MQCLKKFLRDGCDRQKIRLIMNTSNIRLIKEERLYYSNILNTCKLSLAIDSSTSKLIKESFKKENEIKIFSRYNVTSTIKVLPLRNKKGKSNSGTSNYFVDMKLASIVYLLFKLF